MSTQLNFDPSSFDGISLPQSLLDYVSDKCLQTGKASSANGQIAESINRKMNKSKRARYRRRAKELGISFEEYVVLAEEASAKQPKSNSKNRAATCHKIAEEFTKALGDRISFYTYDDSFYPELLNSVPEGILSICKDAKGDHFNPWQRAKGIQDGKLYQSGSQPRTPLFAEYSPEEVLDIAKAKLTDDRMTTIEAKFATKYGDFIKQPFEEWAENLHPFFEDFVTEPSSKHHHPTLMEAIKMVLSKLMDAVDEQTGEWWLKPLSIEDALQKVPSDGNSGYPFFTSKWSQQDDMVNYYVEQAKRLVEGSDELIGTPHILWTRIQNDGAKSKIRPVECPAKSEAIAARSFSDPLINILKTIPQFCGFNGGDNVYRYLDGILDKEFLYSLDYSKFDAHCQFLMPYILKMISVLYGAEYQEYFRNIEEFYTKVILITPAGILKSNVINGLMSGEGWTSIIGTLANAISIQYVLLRYAQLDEENKDEIMSSKILSFGDDIAMGSNYDFNSSLLEELMAEVGMVANQSKQEKTSGHDAYFSFLGYYYFKSDYIAGVEPSKLPVFPFTRLLPGMVFQEQTIHWTMLLSEVDKLEKKGKITEEVASQLRANIKGDETISHRMATVMRLNNMRNHKNFIEIVDWVRNNTPGGLNSDDILAHECLVSMFRGQRRSRNFGLAKSAIMQALWYLEGKTQGACTSEDVEFQSIYTLEATEVMTAKE